MEQTAEGRKVDRNRRKSDGGQTPRGRSFTVCTVFGANVKITHLESTNRLENSVTSQLPD